jgi:single-strand DNA-binding protein
MSINSITLTGNVGTDPELKETRNGGHILRWRMAGRQGYGENQKSGWVTCSILRSNYAQAMVDAFGKGDMITVNGALSVDEWEDRDGNKRTTVEVIVDGMATPKRDDTLARSQEHDKRKGQGDDDIPF